MNQHETENTTPANNDHQDLRSSLAKCLEKIGSFSFDELSHILKQCSHKRLKKNETLLFKGEVSSTLNFLLKGACYQFSMDDVDENVIELFTEYDCVFNHSSFISQKPSEDKITFFSDGEVLSLSIYSIHELIRMSPVFFKLGKLLDASTQRMLFFDQSMTPQEKYNHILTNRPLVIKTFPLKYIASYLKITPETLSRVRAQI